MYLQPGIDLHLSGFLVPSPQSAAGAAASARACPCAGAGSCRGGSGPVCFNYSLLILFFILSASLST